MQIRRLSQSAAFRFALAYSALFSVSVLLVFAFVYWSTLGVIERQVAEIVAAELRGLAEQYRQEGLGGLLTSVENRSGVGGDPDSVYLLADPRGRSLAGNLRSWPDTVRPDGEWVQLQLYRTDPEETPLLVGGRAFRLSGGYLLLVGRDMGARGRFRSTLVEALAWALTATLGIGIAGALLLSRNLLRRIDGVTETSRRIMQGELAQRIPTTGSGDELDRLAGELNRMLARIETLMTGMRLVTDSLAHDLRSPLTRLKGRIELTLRSDPEPEAYRQALEQSLAELDTVQATFNGLIAIARAEAGISRAQMDRLDLAELAEDVAELYQPAAQEREQEILVSDDAVGQVIGHRQLLAQAISNLIDNAIKYAPRGDRIALRVAVEGRNVLLSVADHGPGIPSDARSRVTERFVRLDSSRSTPGSGLGLSLVAAVASLHDSQLSLFDNEPGLRVEWRFPAADGQAGS